MARLICGLRWLALPAVLAAGSAPAGAQELYAMAGWQYTPSLKETTSSYSFEYAHNLSDYAYASFTWLNEGHVTDHHRDGYSPQIWLRWPSSSRRFLLSAGIGPYRYYDTTYAAKTGSVTDAHGWGVLYSATEGSLSLREDFCSPAHIRVRLRPNPRYPYRGQRDLCIGLLYPK